MIRKFTGALTLIFLLNISVIQAITLPAGFTSVKVGTVYYPTAMAFAPDGRIFMCEKGGRVKIVKNGQVLSTPFLQLNVEQTNERGLGGIVLDPNFSSNHYVYVYYTVPGSSVHNRLSRFTANGDVVVPGSEVQLINFEPVVNSIHNGGGMVFGPDGKLYLGIGDDKVSSNAQNLNTHKGKILRINKDGTAPADNPFAGGTITRRIWALGFRNPYTLAINSSGKIYANDVGEGAWEEINDVTVKGKNFGWPAVEGNSSNSNYTNPVYAYSHGSSNMQGCAITGGAFFNSGISNYPAQYSGKYFFIDYCNGWINYINSSGSPSPQTFATGINTSASNVMQGKDGNLYYFKLGDNSINRITYNNTNPPVIVDNPDNVSVAQGQSASFSVAATGAQPLSYQWRKNGTNITGATSSTYTISSVQSSHAGTYSCRVANSYGTVFSGGATLTVTSFNTPPVAKINSPANGTIYRAGQVINFSGQGTDTQDGTLPASKLTWMVEFHHDSHIHPGPNIAPNIYSGSFTIPNTGETSSNVFYRLVLIATDNGGLKDTTHIDIIPKKSQLTLKTQPLGLSLNLDGQPHATPFTQTQVSGLIREIEAVSPQSFNGNNYVFSHWLHGGAATQNIAMTDTNRTLTAVYNFSGVSTNDTVIAKKSNWKYKDNGSNLGSAWQTSYYDDSQWASGNAEFGYGDGDENTVVSYGPSSTNKYITTYFRKSFNINDVNDYPALELLLKRDDGAIVYLNGVEVFRNNMPSGTVGYNTFAITGLDGADETNFISGIISSDPLVNGNNVIAVEIHQSYGASSDLSFDLILKKSTATPCAMPVNLFASNLTTTSAKLNWTASAGNNSFNVRYRKTGATLWTNLSTSATSTTISNLTAGTNYEFQVQAVCNSNSSSYVPGVFKTLSSSGECAKPYGLSASNITHNSATLNWGAVVSATGYNVQYRKSGTTNVMLITTSTNSVNISNLSSRTAYEFQVQALCGGTSAQFTAYSSFNTKAELAPGDPSLGNLPFPGRLADTSGSIFIDIEKMVEFNVFPNPYSYETNIIYKLDTISAVRMDVIDVTGRIIYEFNEIPFRQDPGNYNYSFAPSELGLTKGMYIVRLMINDKVITRKTSYVD